MATVANKLSHQSLDANCERIIAQFEQSPDGDAVEFAREVIEKVALPYRPALITELARIELERNFARDYLDEIDWKPSRFCSAFGVLLEDTHLRSDLGFEHYRLARLHGRAVTRQSIGALYGMSGDQWKELPPGSSFDPHSSSEVEYPRIGESFCNYPLIAELGRGALARVYLARQTDLAGRLVVLKISSRLNAEAEKLARLQHTNIVPVYSVHRSPKDAQLYAICMPYLGSLTLADLLTLFEGKSKTAGRIEELISTLVARRRSTLISTTQSPGKTDNTLSPSTSRSPRPPQDLPASSGLTFEAQAPATASRLERQLGYDELMGTLHSLVQKPNDIQSACRLIEGIASGIAYAHSIGIVHRDLKPENVLIANDGRPVVLDFNLSDESAGARPGIVGGTLPYMSMQQLQSMNHERRVSPTDDVFAIGTIFYRLLTGQLPYASRSIDQLTQLIEERKTPPKSVRELSPHVPLSLTSIVMKCLSADENKRYPSAVELVEDLTCFRQHRTLRYATDRSLTDRFQRLARRHPVITSSSFIASVAAFIVLALGIGWMLTTQRASQLTQQLQLRQLISSMPTLVSQLRGPYRDAPQLQRGVKTASQLLGQWNIDTNQPLNSAQLNGLTALERREALEQLGQLAFSLASAESNLSLLDAVASSSQGHQHAALQWNRLAEQLAPQLGPACRFQRSQIRRQPVSNSAPEDLSDASSRAKSKPVGDLATADTPLAKLLLAQQSGDWQGWLHWADTMATEHPEDAGAWFNLGAAHYTLGHFERAWSCFDVSARLQTGSLTSIFWRGVTSYQLGQHPRAIRDFNQCLDVEADWIAARQNRALAAFASQKLDDALVDATYLIDKQQAGPRVWLLRAQVHAMRGHKDLAQADRQVALAAPCQSADDWVAIGVQEIGTQPEQALAAFRKAQALEPTNLAAWQNSAHVLSEQLQQSEQALEAMEKLIALRPNQASHYATRGILAARLQKSDLALSDAQHTGRLQPKAIEMLQIAGIYALLSQKKDAPGASANISSSLDWLRRALLDDPSLAHIAEQDPDLAALHDEPKCKELIESAKTLCKMN